MNLNILPCFEFYVNSLKQLYPEEHTELWVPCLPPQSFGTPLGCPSPPPSCDLTGPPCAVSVEAPAALAVLCGPTPWPELTVPEVAANFWPRRLGCRRGVCPPTGSSQTPASRRAGRRRHQRWKTSPSLPGPSCVCTGRSQNNPVSYFPGMSPTAGGTQSLSVLSLTARPQGGSPWRGGTEARSLSKPKQTQQRPG